MAGEMLSQWCRRSVSPSTPPSVTDDIEWTLYSPNARIAEPRSDTIMLFALRFLAADSVFFIKDMMKTV